MPRILLLNKPYGVLTQFTDSSRHPGLGRYVPIRGVYPAGRLDRDSEGLVVLTDHGPLQHRLSHPRHKLEKVYWVQVEGEPDAAALDRLRSGITLKDGPTAPVRARRLAPPALWPREPPIRYRKTVPTAWIEMVLTEGRNRQVRRMTAAVGHPTLRLVRYAIGSWTVEGLSPGVWRSLSGADVRMVLSSLGLSGGERDKRRPLSRRKGGRTL